MRKSSILSTALPVVVLCGVLTGARQTASVPASYNAITTRTLYQEPTVPVLGPAGYHFVDPTFGSRMLRVTDSFTRPGEPGRSFVTGSAAHQLAWNATSDKFWIRGVDGHYIPYTFNASTMTAARINPTSDGNGGLTILSQLEPQFSFVSSNLLFGTRFASGTNTVIRRFDFNTLTYTDILDLTAITTVPPNTYARALAGSAAAPEKLSVLFGGASQNSDYKVAVFQVSSPAATAVVLNTQLSTITRGGTTNSTNIGLGFNLHHAWIDLSGRYVVLNPVNGSFPPPLPYFIWDLNTDLITKVTRFPGGHDALGYGRQVNQECCTTTLYDGAQWQLRALSAPTATTDLINPVGSPQVVFIADHTSWNNAQPGTLVPILSSLYRYDSSDTTPWRAWDDEIVAIQTGAHPSGATVWRFAHHRSNVFSDGGGPTQQYFWYLPRAMISPDGRWAMFTSNWEKTLGPTTGSDVEPGGSFRSDVFIVALGRVAAGSFTDDPLTIGISVVRAIHITELRSRIDALRIRFGLMAFPWTDPTLGAGMVIRSVHLTEMRAALQQAYLAGKQTAPLFTDPTIVPGSTFISAVHIRELRSFVISLESS